MDFVRSFGKALKAVFALVIPTITAAGAGDNTEVDGQSIDRKDYHAAVFTVVAQAVLTAAKSLNVNMTIQDSADASSWADVAAALQPGGAANSLVLTLTSAGGGTERGVYKLPVDLSSLRRYVRVQLLPDLTHTGTDTATVACTCALGGGIVEPPLS